MKKKQTFILTIIMYISSYSTMIYKGDIEGSKITLFMDYDKGVYVYDKYKIPIPLDITKDKKDLILKSENEIFTFQNYDEEADKIQGKWKNRNKVLVVNLEKELDTIKLERDTMVEIPMFYSTRDEYFWIKIRTGGWYATSEEILVYNKNNGKLLQTIDMRFGEWRTFIGVTSLAVDDYNFDEILDFSLFGSYFVGANTISNYFLKNNNEYKLAPSYYETSLYFDKEEKKVYSENSTRAGYSRSVITFVVKENEYLIPIKKFQVEISDDEITHREITSIIDTNGEWIKVEEKIY